MLETIYKPSSVLRGYLSRFVVANKFKRHSTNAPVKAPLVRSYLASSGVYTASPVTEGAVSSCLAFSSLPIGRLFSVALSLKSPSPAVSRHPALRSSDFPRHGISAAPQPHGRLKQIDFSISMNKSKAFPSN